MNTQTKDNRPASERGIFNPAIKSNHPYVQHVCPVCRIANGENSFDVWVQCDCGNNYKTPSAHDLADFRSAEHAALVAVAEVAKEIDASLKGREDWEYIRLGAHATPARLMRSALADLESIRNGGGK